MLVQRLRQSPSSCLRQTLADRSTPRSVLDIGFECGFGSSASFYRVFRKATGKSPRAYAAQTSSVEGPSRSDCAPNQRGNRKQPSRLRLIHDR
ncbi:MAG: AraC family transcriptional regulator [Xanthomonadales bacterium]|nr:AraC family transcriptional regulator [Xanthomonadales bacterium]